MKKIILTTVLSFAMATAMGQYTTTDSTATSLIQTGSVDKVTESRMNKGLVTNSLSALSGQAAGVNVTSGDNRMAMLSSVRVRGTTSLTGGNDPLVIIDGVSSDLATLSSIYPADIESFSILKNAAETAQYGSRGASGVIQVTTKKGHGGQFHISYDGNIGFQSVHKNIEMLDRYEYNATAQQMGLSYIDGGTDTNFRDAITRTGLVQNHHVAFSGGSETSNYRASIGLMDNNTVIRNNEYSSIMTKLDLTQRAFDNRLKIDLGVFGSSHRNKNIFDEQLLFYSAAAQNPTFFSHRDINGDWQTNTTASQINHPMALLEEKDHEKILNVNTHIGFTFDITKDLKLKLFGSYTFNSTENMQYLPTWVWAQGQAYRGERKTEDWLSNVTLNYQRAWGVHHLELTALSEYQESHRSGFYTTVKGFSTNEFGYDNLKAGALRPYGGTGSDWEKPVLASWMGSVKYTLLDRYTINVTARADGSSMVGENNRWGFFPSVSFEWDVMKEQFMKKASLISQLKFRTGSGLSGNLGGIDSYNSLQLLQPIGVVPVYGTTAVTLGYVQNANPDLKWETRSSFNIGMDLGLWRNRIVMTAEFYYSKTRDMLYLYDVSVPPFAYDKLLANLGSMSNSGFEMGIGITPVETRDMELNINMNMSFQKNKLISLSGYYQGQYMSGGSMSDIGKLNGAGFHGSNNNIVYRDIGQPLGVFYLPHCTGLYEDEDGDYYYGIADLNGDGVADCESDRYIAGQATPKMTLGSNISFRYKNIDVSLQMNGAFGHKIYNGTSLSYMNMGSFPDYNVMKDAPKKRIYDQEVTDYWLERGDYLNFDYLTIGWNVPMKSRFISSLRLSCSVNNLATITGYSGLTPMINSYVVNNTLGIDDKRSYPPYRSYSFGVSIQF
ncbi:MAG: SusC/RagA family TonB-linked outer membrane protein [Prevotella sp.]|nr:SusC/RagA family TonB-linked outer membrane protein [Prevotella sp.]